MFLKDIREWLKEKVNDSEVSFFIGKIDASKEKAICIYNRPGNNNKIAVGGLENTSTANKSICILVHWNKNCDTSERAAKGIYDLFNGNKAVINNVNAFFVMKNDEPIGVGTDSTDIYEFAIDLNITYGRNDN